MPHREPANDHEQTVVDHTEVNRRKMQAAYQAVRTAGRGRVMGDVAVGYDHTLPDDKAAQRWWCRVDVAGVAMAGYKVRYVQSPGRPAVALQEVLLEGYPSAVDALEAMAQRLSALLRLN